MPQLGGYDTWGASGVDPTCKDYICLDRVCENNSNGYEIYNNKLYLFWSEGGKEAFNLDPKNVINHANATWNTFLTNNNYKYCFNTDLFKPCTKFHV